MGDFGHYSPLCFGVLHLISSLDVLLFDHFHCVNCGIIGPPRLHHEHFTKRSLPNDLVKFEACTCVRAHHFYLTLVAVLGCVTDLDEFKVLHSGTGNHAGSCTADGTRWSLFT